MSSSHVIFLWIRSLPSPGSGLEQGLSIPFLGASHEAWIISCEEEEKERRGV